MTGRALSVACAVTLASCGAGNGSSLDETGRSFSKPWTAPVGAAYGAASFEATYTGVQGFFDRFCTECHEGPAAPRGLDLSGDGAYERLVGARAQQRPDLFLVEPGQPQRSYLVLKLEGTGITGRQMPRNRPARPATEIDTVKTWIDSGALRD